MKIHPTLHNLSSHQKQPDKLLLLIFYPYYAPKIMYTLTPSLNNHRKRRLIYLIDRKMPSLRITRRRNIKARSSEGASEQGYQMARLFV